MKIMLQDKGSLDFIKDLDGGWTGKSELAHAFSTGLEAVFFCFKLRMRNMQIVASFLDTRMNFCVPVCDVRAK